MSKMDVYRKNELFGYGEKPGRGEAHLGPRQLGHKQLQLRTTKKGKHVYRYSVHEMFYAK